MWSVVAESLSRLEAEPFGSKMRRAREHADLQMRDAAEVLCDVATLVSYTTIARLEHELTVPRSKKRRAMAMLLLLAYGIDPEDLGLDVAELPAAWRPELVGGPLREAAAARSGIAFKSPFGESAALDDAA